MAFERCAVRSTEEEARGLWTCSNIPAYYEIGSENCLVWAPSFTANVCWGCLQVIGSWKVSFTNLKRCTGCRIARFCSRTCQLSEWNSGFHNKSECTALKEAMSSGAQTGSLVSHTPLLVRRCIAVVADGKKAAASTAMRSHFANSHSTANMSAESSTLLDTLVGSGFLPLELLAQVESFLTPDGMHITPDRGVVEYLLGVLRTNVMTMATADGFQYGYGLFEKGSLLNHCCIPNAAVVFSGRSMVAFSTTTIPAGEEVYISYDSLLQSKPVPLRRRYLAENYGFRCNCRVCTSESAKDGYATLSPTEERLCQELDVALSCSNLTQLTALVQRFKHSRLSSLSTGRRWLASAEVGHAMLLAESGQGRIDKVIVALASLHKLTGDVLFLHMDAFRVIMRVAASTTSQLTTEARSFLLSCLPALHTTSCSTTNAVIREILATMEANLRYICEM